jgi:hypothetical protein
MNLEKLLDHLEQYRGKEGSVPPNFREGVGAAITALPPDLRAQLDKLVAHITADNSALLCEQIRNVLTAQDSRVSVEVNVL